MNEAICGHCGVIFACDASDANPRHDCDQTRAHEALESVRPAFGGWLEMDDPMLGVIWLSEAQSDMRVLGISEPWIDAPGFHDDRGHWLICLYASSEADEVLDEYTGTSNDEARAFIARHTGAEVTA